MATMQDVVSMLEDAGAQRIYGKNPHLKYKLPSGAMFVGASTASDIRSWDNALARVRRELRPTHPEIANRGRQLPKHKRLTNTIGDQLMEKGLIASPAPLLEAEFEIVPAEIKEEPETLYYKVPRTKKSHIVPPSQARTLSRDKLMEANRILATLGEGAMTAFLNSHREELVAVDRSIIEERFAEPVRVEPNRVHSEDDTMADVLERARKELEATEKRITKLTAEALATETSLATEVERKKKLDAYIVAHEELITQATEILTLVPAPPPPPENLHVMPDKPKKKNYYKPLPAIAVSYTRADLRAKVFPRMIEQGVVEFAVPECMKVISEMGFTGPEIQRARLQQWLHNEIAKKHGSMLVKGSGSGLYRLVGSQVEERAARFG